jgi:hypothetical protein
MVSQSMTTREKLYHDALMAIATLIANRALNPAERRQIITRREQVIEVWERVFGK